MIEKSFIKKGDFMMTRFKLAASALVICCLLYSSSNAKTYTQKTFLAPRPVGFNSEMEYTTWHEHVYKKRENKRVRSHFMATGFYQASQNNSGLAKYFGAGDPCDCPIRKGFNVVKAILDDAGDDIVPPARPKDGDIAAQLIIAQTAGPDEDKGSTLRGNALFSPEQETWGLRLDYFQDVTHPFGKLFFKASLPIVYVKNDMKLLVSESKTVKIGAGEFSLADFLAGRVDNTDPTKATDPTNNINDDMLSPLKKAKIGCGKRDTTSTADLDLALGYKFKDAEKSHFFGNVAITIPLGTRVRGEYIFEPIAGNGRHWGLGAGINAGAHLWQNKRASFRFLTALNYKYLFENCEMRTIGIKPCSAAGNKMAHYIAVGKKGQTSKPLQPAANILTQQLNVRPGHMFDGLAALSFNSSNFTLDLGYSLFFKDNEKITLKKSPCFDISDYGLAAHDYLTINGGPFGEDAGDLLTGKFLSTADLDLDAPKTPWQLTHKIFAGIGYTGNIYKKYPASIGLGGSYEFTIDNAALENAAVWIKTAFSF